MSKKKRKSIFDDLFDFSIFDEFEEGSLGESGYYINVTQEGGKTTVYVKAGENVDTYALKEDLKRKYPGAEIIIEGEKPLLEEVKIEDIKKEEDKNKVQKKEKKNSLIEEIN